MSKIRTRYAPSPTGMQHIGGIRTALFNYFFAKSKDGDFLLRIEDTDRNRYSEEALQDIEDSFEFLSIKYDERYVQSSRFEIYRKMAYNLIESGKAYKCFCSEERLESLREEQKKTKSSHLGYDGKCRMLNYEEIKIKEESCESYVIRLKLPKDRKITFYDQILGQQEYSSNEISPDPILLKSDGFPTYHLANIVDDHEMHISHVLRSQEWLSSTPLHILLYEAFGWEPPKFCHLPMVLGEDGKKLSKRHGSISLKEFIKEGYLAEAIINYISLLGLSFKSETEFATKEEITKLFELSHVVKSPAIFDYKKLKHFNFHYLNKLSEQEYIEKALPFLIESGIFKGSESEIETIKLALPILRERAFTLKELSELCRFIFENPIKNMNGEELIPVGQKQAVDVVYKLFLESLDLLDIKNIENCETQLKTIAKEKNIKIKDFFMPLRLCLTGSKNSPPIPEIIKIIGKEEARKRVEEAIQKI